MQLRSPGGVPASRPGVGGGTSSAVGALLSRSHMGSEASSGGGPVRSVAQESYGLSSSMASPLFQGVEGGHGRRRFADSSPVSPSGKAAAKRR